MTESVLPFVDLVKEYSVNMFSFVVRSLFTLLALSLVAALAFSQSASMQERFHEATEAMRAGRLDALGQEALRDLREGRCTNL